MEAAPAGIEASAGSHGGVMTTRSAIEATLSVLGFVRDSGDPDLWTLYTEDDGSDGIRLNLDANGVAGCWAVEGIGSDEMIGAGIDYAALRVWLSPILDS
jgi:hypothetical protein